MSKALDRSQRAGSDPIQIGSTKLVTDGNNDLTIQDTSNNRKKILASELHIGDSSNVVILKKGSDNKIEFQTQASGESAESSNSGGGVTVVANTTALQALTGNAVGDLAFVSANNKLYLRQTNGWYTVATVANATPIISSAGNASYTFATDGTPIVITVTATEPEGETITYGHSVTGSASGIATITQGTGSNVNQFTLTPATSGNGGSFSVVFTAQDPNGNTATSSSSSFSLTFASYGSAVFDGTGDYLATPTSNDLVIGTNDFTIEYWAKSNDFNTAQTIFDRRASHSIDLKVGTNGSGQHRVYANGSYRILTTATTANTWNHVVLQRSSNVLKMYLNGTEQSTTYTDTNNYTGNKVVLGMEHNGYNQGLTGYISNFRMVVGSTVYSGNFTVPTSPLTAITNTKLLTVNKDDEVTDDSNSNHTITKNGNATQHSSHPF